MDQETFKMVWRDIDTEGTGRIETTHFVMQLQSRGHDEAAIEKWIQVLDAEGAGTISVNAFSEALDIHPDELVVPKGLPGDVQKIDGDMPLDWQMKVVKATKDVLSQEVKFSEVSKRIKTNLERTYGPLWHVMVVHGQFSCFFGFQPGYSFIFKIGKQFFIVFKTPQT